MSPWAIALKTPANGGAGNLPAGSRAHPCFYSCARFVRGSACFVAITLPFRPFGARNPDCYDTAGAVPGCVGQQRGCRVGDSQSGEKKDANVTLRVLERDWDALADDDLIGQTLDGTKAAYGALVRRYTPLLQGFLYGRLRIREDADDIVQDTFVAAYMQLGTLRSWQRFGPWLIEIARNTHIDFERKRRVRPEVLPLAEAATSVETRPTAGGAELREAVTAAIAALPDRYRSLVYLRLVEEYEPREIARLHGVREATVRMQLLRGLRLVRKSLQHLDLDDYR